MNNLEVINNDTTVDTRLPEAEGKLSGTEETLAEKGSGNVACPANTEISNAKAEASVNSPAECEGEKEEIIPKNVNYRFHKYYKTAKYPIRQPIYLTWLPGFALPRSFKVHPCG